MDGFEVIDSSEIDKFRTNLETSWSLFTQLEALSFIWPKQKADP